MANANDLRPTHYEPFQYNFLNVQIEFAVFLENSPILTAIEHLLLCYSFPFACSPLPLSSFTVSLGPIFSILFIHSVTQSSLLCHPFSQIQIQSFSSSLTLCNSLPHLSSESLMFIYDKSLVACF